EIGQRVREARQKLEQILSKARNEKSNSQTLSRFTGMPSIPMSGFNASAVTSASIEKFTHEWEKYLKQLEQALKWQRSYQSGWRVEITLQLNNASSAIANGLELALQFPKESFVIDR